MDKAIPCPNCGEDLQDLGELTLVGWVDRSQDPNEETKLDLILECEGCLKQFNAFVPLNDFYIIEQGA